MSVKKITLDHTEIVVNRQALLTMVRALDIGHKSPDLPYSMDRLREPFFADEITSGKAREDFSMNTYGGGGND